MNHRAHRWSAAVLTAFSLMAPAWANDGPYLRLDTALVEDDDERTFEDRKSVV